MDHLQCCKSACHNPAGRDRQAATIAISFLGNCKRWRCATPGLILFCLITLFGSPARSQLEPDERLAPQDTVEVRISRWTALRGGVTEGAALSNTFTIGASGTLDLPFIGQLPAAGLRASELEQLITDRLQARSGLHERPLTTVTKFQRKNLDESGSVKRSPASDGTAPAPIDSSSAAASERVDVEGRQAQPGSIGAGPTATEQQQALEGERSRANALLRELAVARMEAAAAREELLVGREAARYEALRYGQLLTAERQSTATLTKELDAVRADLEEARARLAEEAKGASRVRQAREVQANKEHELAVRERAKGATLEQDLLVARREIDVLKNRAQSIAGREEALRRELAAAREQLDAMRHAADVASAQARAVAEMTAEQKRLREEQQQRAEGLARDLRLAQREVDSLTAKAGVAMRESAAVHRARHAAEAALVEARRALDEERHKIGLYKRDLALARESINALEARAKLAAAALATAQAAESAAEQAAEALALERARADSVARTLNAAHQQRDAAKEELSRASVAQRKALEQERDRVSALSRDLTAARREIDNLKTREARQSIDNLPKARAADRARPRASTPARKGARQAKVRKPPRTIQLTKVLPDALLPTKPPIHDSRP